MRLSLRARITIYVIALAVVATGFLTGGIVTWKKREFWVAQLAEWDFESVQLASHCRAAFHELNFRLLRYELSRIPGDRLLFDRADAAFADWLKDQLHKPALPEIHDLLGQLAEENSHYRNNAARFLANLPSAEAINPENQLLVMVEADATRILALEEKLRLARRAGFESLVARGRLDLDRLWTALFACLLLLLVCVAVLARLVYRDLIAPLRRTVAQTRALLERREKLSALGLLAAGLAHEIRNPLNSIKARLYTQRRLMDGHPAGLEDNRFIEGEIDRLEGLVKETLQFARPGPPAFQPVRVSSVLDALCDLLRPSLAKYAIQLKTDIQADGEISGDPNQLKQALLNLVNNAADSIGREGTITVRTRNAILHRPRERRAAVAIEIEDTGQGLTPEAQQRLFDPFFTTKTTGTGLGLSITARIVDGHGGLIEWESPTNRGALFRILLPVAYAKDAHPAR